MTSACRHLYVLVCQHEQVENERQQHPSPELLVPELLTTLTGFGQLVQEIDSGSRYDVSHLAP